VPIDEGRDLGQALVGPRHRAGVDAQLAALSSSFARFLARRLGTRRTRRRPLTAPQKRRDLALGEKPAAMHVADARPLRTANPTQPPGRDREIPPRLDGTLQPSTGQLLVVIVTLVVAVIDPAHRRVAPVDDLHAGRAIDVSALADQDIALLAALAQP